MADANGSSPSPQYSSGGEAVTGDFVAVPGAGPHGSFQALLASVGGHAPPGAAANVLAQHQYQQYHQLFGPAGPLIQAPPQPMPLRVQAPSPTPPPPHCAQSNLLLPAGRYPYQHWQPPAPQIGVAAAPQVPIRAGGFGDWTMYNFNSSFVSVACGSSSSVVRGSNGYHQSSRLCSATAWPNFRPRSPYSVYPHGIQQDHQAITYHGNNNHEQGSGFVSNFRVDPPLLPAQCFQPISPASNNHSPAQFFDEATYTKKAKRDTMRTQKEKNSEDPPEMESENSDELDHAMLDENQNLNQGQEIFTTRFNCKDYHMIVWKELTNSDVGNIGRIILPKRDAEANLPALLERDGLILKMEDLKLPVTWSFKFRFWPNNKSRMYVLESTGEFSKNHNLEPRDTFIIYKSLESGKFLVRGEKVTGQCATLLCPECKEEGSINKQCGFTRNLHAKKKR